MGRDKMIFLVSDEIDLSAGSVGVDIAPGHFHGRFIQSLGRFFATELVVPPGGGILTGPRFNAGTDIARLNVYNNQQNPLVQMFNAGIRGVSAAIPNTTGGTWFDLAEAHPLLDVTAVATYTLPCIWKVRLVTIGFLIP